MTRKREHNLHLPPRVVHKHGAYHYRLDGKMTRIGATYAEMLARYHELEKQQNEDPTPQTIRALYDRYVRLELRTKAEKTQKGRLQEFKPILKVFGTMHPQDVKTHHAFNHWDLRGRRPQAKKEVKALSALLSYGIKIGAREGPNPCFDMDLPEPKRNRYVTHEEYEAMRALAPPMIRCAMALAWIGGLDQKTIRTLERRHLKADGIEFVRAKTARSTETPRPQILLWNPELRAVIDEALALAPQVRQAIICNRRGKAYSSDGFQTQWQRVKNRALKAGVIGGPGFERFTFHDLRAKSASDARSEQEAADRLGHADPRLTRKIYRRLPERMERAGKTAPKPREAVALSLVPKLPKSSG